MLPPGDAFQEANNGQNQFTVPNVNNQKSIFKPVNLENSMCIAPAPSSSTTGSRTPSPAVTITPPPHGAPTYNNNQQGGKGPRSKKKTTGPVHNSRYKAKLCKNWTKTGNCPYYEKCQFAHGTQELDKWANRRARLKLATEAAAVGAAQQDIDDLSDFDKDSEHDLLPEISPSAINHHEEEEKETTRFHPIQIQSSTCIDERVKEEADVTYGERSNAYGSKSFTSTKTPHAILQKTKTNNGQQNQCIGQLFSMSTVFPSSISHNLGV